MLDDQNITTILELPPDRFLVCQNCSLTYVWTGWEQQNQELTPDHCPGCRHVRLLTRRQRGTVKWYDVRKNYGFITAIDGSEVFVHRQALGRLRKLNRGDVVAFSLEQGQLGLQATGVERLSARKVRKRTRRRKNNEEST